jgi:hypothetical protein
MNDKLKRAFLSGLSTVLVSVSGLAAAAPVQAVHGLDVDNSAAFLAAIDTLFESDDIAEHKVSIWAAVFDGSSPTTHVVVEEFDSYAQYDAQTARRLGSNDWPRFGMASDDILKSTGSALHIQRVADGSGWRNHDAAAVFVMTVKDPAAYTAAFSEMIGAVDNPGSVRLMEIRAGGMGATHLAIITGESLASVNQYLDDLLASDAYRSFVGKVGEIRKIRTVSMYRRIRTHGD